MQPKNLYTALSPLFFISLLLGTSPIYSKKNNGKHSLKTSNIFKMITLVYLALYTTSLIQGIHNLDARADITRFKNAMSSIGLILEAVGQIILIYSIYLFSFVIPKNVKNVIDRLAMVDSVLNDLGWKNNYNHTFWQQIVLLLTGIFTIGFTIVLELIIISSNQSTRQIEGTVWFVHYFPILVAFVAECQFSILVFLIYQRFRTINEMLNEMSSNANAIQNGGYFKVTPITSEIYGSQIKVSSTTSVLRKVETLMQIHDSMVDAANELNTNYSFQILTCLAVLFVKSVFAIFFAYFEQFVHGKTMIAFSWTIWSTIDWIEIILLAITCHMASVQAQQTGVEVHKLLMNSKDNIIRDKLIIFSQQIFHRPVEFSACGLFLIDAPLIFTIMGSATTYLLIMLQFQEGTEANCVIGNSTIVQ